MDNSENKARPVFSHAEPVLPVKDVPATIHYWQTILGFPKKWTWGDPPTFGSVSWDSAFIQFITDPQLADRSKGNNIWIRVRRLETLYALHVKNHAEIVCPPENRDFGMAQYSLRECNGYYLHFAGPLIGREKSAADPPPQIRIVPRPPTEKEFRDLEKALGGQGADDELLLRRRLSAVLFGVVAEDTVTGEIIGCALLVGDHASYYYVKDVFVRPDWQGQRVGTGLMEELMRWLDQHGVDQALVGLFAREELEPFYQQWGFTAGFGMLKYIKLT
jgi:GNAT superfamily N-acetyltransferase